MPTNFPQAIVQSGSIRQSGTSPAAIAQAEVPKLPVSASYEGIEGGTATDWAVILTALGVEHKAVEAHLEPIGQATRLSEEIHPNGTIYTQGQFKAHNGTWNVAIAQIDMGNASAAMEAIRAIEHFVSRGIKVRVILFVGVAGGIKYVKVGDVVAATKVYGYESGKVANQFFTRPEVVKSAYALIQRSKREAGKTDWLQQLAISSPSQPRVFVAPIAAGEKVVASKESDVFNFIRASYNDAIAVEMEGFGFLSAALTYPDIKAIVVRGISDLIEGKNDDSVEPEQIRQERAARHASAFAFTLLAKLDGEGVTERSEVYQTTAQMDLDSTLPEDIISLNVQAPLEENQYYIHAHHGKRIFANRGQFDRSLLELYGQIENQSSADDQLSVISRCNKELRNSNDCIAGQFLAWLYQQHEPLSDKVKCLIIDDRTEIEIPWELLKLKEKPVGVAFRTARQRQIEPELVSVDFCCGGGILGYACAEYRGWQQYQQKRFTVFQDFLRQMQNPSTDFGLVFIDGFSFEETLRKPLDVYLENSKLFNSRPCIVFVSGQMNLDTSITPSYRSWLNDFLEYGAKGIIGTLRQVDRARAKEFVEQFSKELSSVECRKHPEWTIPEILRRLRERVWEAWKDDVNENTCASYLATFLHVYYGNPTTRLQLASVEGESND